MAKSQITFSKKEREKKKLQKRKLKEEKRAKKKEQTTSGKLEDMLVYLDSNGNIIDTPPDETDKKVEIDPASIAVSTPKSAPVDLDAERRGKVEFFNHNKGYGFIVQSNSEEKFFVHDSNLIDKVNENDKVKFSIEKGERGFQAVNVKKI